MSVLLHEIEVSTIVGVGDTFWSKRRGWYNSVTRREAIRRIKAQIKSLEEGAKLAREALERLERA